MARARTLRCRRPAGDRQQPDRKPHPSTAIGKKNWLFIGQAQAGTRSAIIYTVIECCRRRGLDPFTYLRDVFTRLPSMTNWQVKDLTPEAWAKARKRADLRATA